MLMFEKLVRDKSMKVLVTGGAGFIGSHIVERLLKAEHEVVVVDNLDPYYNVKVKETNVEIFKNNPNYTFVNGDIFDKKLMKELIGNVDAIFHLAAQAGVRASIANPRKTFEINTIGTFNLLEICLDGDIKKFVNSSSSSVYGKVKYLPFDEEHPTNPISPYGVSKLAAEHYCRVFYEVYGLKTVNLRYFTVYGPRMRPDLAISIFTRNALRNEPIEIFGDGTYTRDFTYIDNIVDLNIKVLKNNSVNGETFNVGTGEQITVSGLAKKIIELTGSSSKVIFSNREEGDMEHT
ncbi:MAG TPA: SDR family NAD(P)-dependent oxidoreductase, partial [Candidatus Cloacimonetes bacterium]|nr:SDR family NAD(P)-dependent oxidoreductase [Candidatus Cloacimonadota bacterium]